MYWMRDAADHDIYIFNVNIHKHMSSCHQRLKRQVTDSMV